MTLVHLNVYPLVVINYDTTGQIGFAYVHPGWTGDTCEIEPPLPQVSLEGVISELQTKVENSKPLKCVPLPGEDKLQYNGADWICVLSSGWTGDTCEIEPIVYLCGFGWGGVGWQGLTGVEAATFCQETWCRAS